MKFLTVALATFFGVATANTRISTSEINRRIQKGQFNKQTLLSKARPYGRRADENAEDAQFEITGDYSIQFNTCLSLKIESEDLFDEDIVDLAAADIVIAEKSLILFDVCETAYCYYDAEDTKSTYIVDIATFVQALAEYLPTQRETYCDACEENRDYCETVLGWSQEDEAADDAEDGEGDNEDGDNNEDGEDGEDDNEEGDNNEDGEDGEDDNEDGDNNEDGEDGEDRKLAEATIEYIDCYICTDTYQCLAQDDEDGDNQDEQEEEEENEMDYENAVAWIQEIAECSQLNNNDGDEDGGDGDDNNNVNYYGGFICNEYGSGIELAVFLDEDCTLYDKQLPFGNFVGDDDATSYYKSSYLIEHMFTNALDCAASNVQYVNPDDYAADENADDENADDEDADNEASEFCQNLFAGDFEATSIANCEEADEDEDGDDQEEDENAANYDWYTYDLSNEDADDAQAVCRVVQSLNGEYYTVYDSSSGGQFYDYSQSSQNSTGARSGMSGGAIFGIIVLIAVACAGAAWAFTSKKKEKSDKKKPLISGSMA